MNTDTGFSSGLYIDLSVNRLAIFFLFAFANAIDLSSIAFSSALNVIGKK